MEIVYNEFMKRMKKTTRKAIKADKILDVTGLQCPQPTVMAMKALTEIETGKVLQVISNDSSTKDTIPSLCSEHGCNLIEFREEGGLFIFTIRK